MIRKLKKKYICVCELEWHEKSALSQRYAPIHSNMNMELVFLLDVYNYYGQLPKYNILLEAITFLKVG